MGRVIVARGFPSSFSRARRLLRSGSLTIDTLDRHRHPSNPVWSPDGRRVAYVWNRAGVENVWLVDLSGPTPAAPRALTRFDSGTTRVRLFWSADGRKVRFAREGDSLDRRRGCAIRRSRPLWTTPIPPAASLRHPTARESLSFATATSGFVGSRTAREKRLTQTPILEGGLSWSPDGTRIAFITSSAERHENAPEYSGAKVLYTWIERGFGDVGIVALDSGSSVTVMPNPEFRENGVRWAGRIAGRLRAGPRRHDQARDRRRRRRAPARGKSS